MVLSFADKFDILKGTDTITRPVSTNLSFKENMKITYYGEKEFDRRRLPELTESGEVAERWSK